MGSLPLGDRWAHVQAVAARAEKLRPAAASDDERHLLLVAVAWPGLPEAAAHPSWLATRAARR